MRNFCLLLAALSVGSAPALAQSSNAAAAPAGNAASKQTATKKVCKRVADVNSLVARKVCRVVVVEANPQPANQLVEQQGAAAQGANE